ncbi:MAG: substrate import-associated zinc metallohydrolase lipoprotein [Ferruginibacter sp.]
MKNIKNISFIACLLLMLASCRKDEVLNVQQPVGLGGEARGTSAIDKWILDSLTTPYNISAKYKWDPFNVSLFKTLTPADESRVLPLFSALKKVWINPYNDETGSELFIKKYSPKQFVLVGSVEYDYYSVTLGQAEGGNNIVFFDVNQNFDKNPVTSIKRVIHTAHHEFAHILHQTVMYPQDFKGTSSKLGLPGYTATWFNVSDAQAFNEGYATAYSRSGPDDDFVEMVSTMLTEGKPKWDEMKAATNATARQALQQKEDFVVTYYRQVWNIDFYSLQRRVQTALNALYPPPIVTDAYGFGKTYTKASVNPTLTTLLPQPAAFTTIYNASKNAVPGLPGGFNLIMDSMAVITNTATTAIVRFYLHQGTATVVFFADFNHTLTKDAAGLFSYTYVSANGNGTIIKPAVTPLLNYFANNKFSISWYTDPSVSLYPRVKFTPQAIPGTYFLALLLP